MVQRGALKSLGAGDLAGWGRKRPGTTGARGDCLGAGERDRVSDCRWEAWGRGDDGSRGDSEMRR
jgi:hypothetical protein